MLGSILGIVRHTSRRSSRQSRPSVLEGLLPNLAQNVGQQGEMMKTLLAEQSTSTHTKLSDISRSQYELSRSQTLIQSRLAKVEETLSVAELFISESSAVNERGSNALSLLWTPSSIIAVFYIFTLF